MRQRSPPPDWGAGSTRPRPASQSFIRSPAHLHDEAVSRHAFNTKAMAEIISVQRASAVAKADGAHAQRRQRRICPPRPTSSAPWRTPGKARRLPPERRRRPRDDPQDPHQRRRSRVSKEPAPPRRRRRDLQLACQTVSGRSGYAHGYLSNQRVRRQEQALAPPRPQAHGPAGHADLRGAQPVSGAPVRTGTSASPCPPPAKPRAVLPVRERLFNATPHHGTNTRPGSAPRPAFANVRPTTDVARR